jgi:hypothetical protein
MTLPEPHVFVAFGASLSLVAVFVGIFLKDIRLAIEIGGVAALMFLCASIANTYEQRGEALVQAKFDAYVTQEKQVVADTTVRWAQAVQQADAGAQARLAAEKERSDALETQAQAVQSRNIQLSGALSDVLQRTGTGASTAPAAAGTNAGGTDASIAVPATTQAQTYDEHELAQWFADVRAAYDSAYLRWQNAVAEYEGIRLGKATLNAHP